jgi:signal transduction histidine kinase/DNA-binding response OmpR family regulator
MISPSVLTATSEFKSSGASSGVGSGPCADEKVKLIQLQLLYSQLPMGVCVTVVNASLLVYILSDVVAGPLVILWLAAVMAACTFRVATAVAFRKLPLMEINYTKWRNIFTVGALTTASLWGFAGIGLFPSDSYQHQAFIGFVLAGMAAGASGSMAAHDRIFRIFLLLTISPYMIRLGMQGAPINIAMALMCAAFIIGLGVAARRNTSVSRDSVRLRFINDDLAHDLEKTVNRYQETNNALHAEISNHQRTTSSLEQAVHDAEASVRAKSRFLANMSHEIRTPMNGVFGMTDLLMRTNLDARQKKLVGTINESAKSLLTIINDILDLSRIESGKLDLDVHEFNLRELLENSVELFAGQAHKKGLEISLYIDPALPAYTKGDSGRIKQIILNLTGNALKFTKYGEIGVRVTSAEAGPSSSRVRIEISDTGIGIDATVLDKLFQPFSQAETSISRRFGGTGLGLAIARHLAEMMGGSIVLDSTFGKGTKAVIELPLEHGVATGAHASCDYAVLDGARIIVIDDRETNREIVTNYLEGCSAKVAQASSTANAWPMLVAALATKTPYHAAIVDMVMPEENGLEFARRIKLHPELSRLKIIIATSMNWHGDIAAIRDAGIEAVLTKPIRRDDLVDAAARAVSGTRHAGWRTDVEARAAQATPHAEFPMRKHLTCNILLAEDNPVNVEVAREYLTSFGCTVSVVGNGLEAIAALKSSKFDLVLMDCQMPIMDGLTATRRIRDTEKTRGLTAVPIVALTANAFAEDRARCFDAGMNGYLSKPYSEDQLYDAVADWTRQASRTTAAIAAPIDAAPITAAIDGRLDQALIAPLRAKRPELLARIIKTFLQHAPTTLTELTTAASAGDCERMGRAAHSLKSSSANLGAMALSLRCRDLETSARINDLPTSCHHALAIAAGFSAVERALEAELASLVPDVAKAVN